MKTLKQTLKNFGWENWVIALTGFGAIAITVLSTFGIYSLSIEKTIQLLLGAMGALMLSVVTLNTNRKSELQEIKDVIGISDMTTLDYRKEYQQQLISEVANVKNFVLETYLNASKPLREPTKLNPYEKFLFQRLANCQINYRQIQIIYHCSGLESVIYRLLLNEDHNYYIYHYDAPPVSIPMLHITSIDDDVFYLGVGYPRNMPDENTLIRIHDAKFRAVFKEHWRVLLEEAVPLNVSANINWRELKRIGSNIGVGESEFNDIVDKCRNQIRSKKYKQSILT
jgi:hypothetical protein